MIQFALHTPLLFVCGHTGKYSFTNSVKLENYLTAIVRQVAFVCEILPLQTLNRAIFPDKLQVRFSVCADFWTYS